MREIRNTNCAKYNENMGGKILNSIACAVKIIASLEKEAAECIF